MVTQGATEEVKVVLGGDGGDELFAGYKRYRQHLRSRWRGSLTIPLVAHRALHPQSRPRRSHHPSMSSRCPPVSEGVCRPAFLAVYNADGLPLTARRILPPHRG